MSLLGFLGSAREPAAVRSGGVAQARLEDHRRQKAEQEAQQDEREIARLQARTRLEARTRWLKAPEAILRALGVPLEVHAGSHRTDIAKTVRKARLTYHPDRQQVRACIELCSSGRQHLRPCAG